MADTIILVIGWELSWGLGTSVPLHIGLSTGCMNLFTLGGWVQKQVTQGKPKWYYLILSPTNHFHYNQVYPDLKGRYVVSQLSGPGISSNIWRAEYRSHFWKIKFAHMRRHEWLWIPLVMWPDFCWRRPLTTM